ncbi:hypothetical protein CPC08DRAFT_714322, partial [Agrocybe pediades]
FHFSPVNGSSSIDAVPTVVSAGLRYPTPAFPAIMEYYPTSVVPAGVCSFPENSSASPPSTHAVERGCCSCQYLFCVGRRWGRESRFMTEARTWIAVDLRLV